MIGRDPTYFQMALSEILPDLLLGLTSIGFASDGEVLVDERTAQLKTTLALVPRGDTAVKGLGNVPHFALT